MIKDNQYIIWSAVGIILLIRLLLTQQMGLMPQDAYYYFYGQHLDFSYFDHPPIIAYFLRGFSEFFGSSEAVIKMTDFALTAGSLFLFYLLTAKFLPKQKAIRTTVFFFTTLLVSVLSLNSTPDVPLIFFWTLSVLLIYKAVFEGKLLFCLLAGLGIGLAFCSKYTALFLLPGLGTFLLLAKRYRHLLWSKGIFLLLIGTLIGAAPVLIWNYQHEWISFLFQSSERAGQIMELKLKPLDFLGNIGTQMLLLLPPLFLALYYAFFRVIKAPILQRTLPDDHTLFLLCFSLPVIIFFSGVSLFYWVKLNWMMPAYMTGIILAGRYLRPSHLSYQLGFAIILHLLIYIEVIYYPVVVRSDDTWVGWTDLAREVEQLQTSFPGYFVFSNDDYKTSAILDFYLNEEVFAGNVIGAHGKQFAMFILNYPFCKVEMHC